MKGYLMTALVCFVLGVSAVIYLGANEKIYQISEALTLRNEAVADVELEMAEQSLERMKLETELKRLEFEVSSRKLSLELAELERSEELRQEVQRAEIESQKDMAWAWMMIKIMWLAVAAFLVPLALLTAVVMQVAYRIGRQGGGHAEQH